MYLIPSLGETNWNYFNPSQLAINSRIAILKYTWFGVATIQSPTLMWFQMDRLYDVDKNEILESINPSILSISLFQNLNFWCTTHVTISDDTNQSDTMCIQLSSWSWASVLSQESFMQHVLRGDVQSSGNSIHQPVRRLFVRPPRRWSLNRTLDQKLNDWLITSEGLEYLHLLSNL